MDAKFLTLLLLVSAICGCKGDGVGVVLAPLPVHLSAPRLNQLVVEYETADSDTGKCVLYYPPDRIFVVVGEENHRLILKKYERVYLTAGDDIPRSVWRRFRDTDELEAISNSEKKYGPVKCFFAQKDSIIVRIRENAGKNNDLRDVGVILDDISSVLLSTYLPRTQAEQFVNGQWQKLANFRCVGFSCVCVGQDTTRLRTEILAFKVSYFPDRVIIDGRPVDQNGDTKFFLTKSRAGYWPHRRLRSPFLSSFFGEFDSTFVDAGDDFIVEFPTMTFPFSFSFEIHVVYQGTLQSLSALINFHGPQMGMLPGANIVSDWPLIPWGMQDSTVNLGYPAVPLPY